jgi:glycosyltransferase involved in cell wall biosynthesis
MNSIATTSVFRPLRKVSTTYPFRLLLLSTEVYPDVKRGGGVFARNLYNVLKDLVFQVKITALRHDYIPVNLNSDIIWVEVPWQITSRIKFLLSLPAYLFSSIQVILKFRPHFIISNGAYECLPPILTRQPFAVVVHDESPLTVGVITRPLLLLALRRSRLILCPSRSIASIISHYTDRRVFIISNYVDKRKQRLLLNAKPDMFFNKHPELKGKKIILFVGAFSSHKGVMSLINSMKKVREVFSDAFLVMVGLGCDPAKSDLSKGIICDGILTDEELCVYLAAADIFVLPSIRSEGFGIALLEALVAEKPVVVGNLPSFREVAQNSAIYVDGRNPESIARALITLLSNKDLVRLLTCRARERSRLFSIERAKQQCIALLEHVKEMLKKR